MKGSKGAFRTPPSGFRTARWVLVIFSLFFLSPPPQPQVQSVDLSIRKLAPERIRPEETIQFVLQIQRTDRFPTKAFDVRVRDVLDSRELAYLPGTVEIAPLFAHPLLVAESLKFAVPDEFPPRSPFPLDEAGRLLGNLSEDFREIFPSGSPDPDNPVIGIQIRYKARAIPHVGSVYNTAELFSSSPDSDPSNNQSSSVTFIDPPVDCLSTCVCGPGCTELGSPQQPPPPCPCGTVSNPFRTVREGLECIKNPMSGEVHLFSITPRNPYGGECWYESFAIGNLGGSTQVGIQIETAVPSNPIRPEFRSENDSTQPIVSIASESNETVILRQLEFFDTDGATPDTATVEVDIPIIKVSSAPAGPPYPSFGIIDSLIHSIPSSPSDSNTANGLVLNQTRAEVKVLRVEFFGLRAKGIEVNVAPLSPPPAVPWSISPEISWSLFRDFTPEGGESPIAVDISSGNPVIRNTLFKGEESGNRVTTGVRFGAGNEPQIKNSVFVKLMFGIEQTSGTSAFTRNAFGQNENHASTNVSLDFGSTTIECVEADVGDCLNLTTLKLPRRSQLIDKGENPSVPEDFDFGRGEQPVQGLNYVEDPPPVHVDMGLFEYHRNEVEGLTLDPVPGSPGKVVLSWSGADGSSKYRVYRGRMDEIYSFDPGDTKRCQIAGAPPTPWKIGDNNAAGAANFLGTVVGTTVYRDDDAAIAPGCENALWYLVLGETVPNIDASVGFSGDGLNRPFESADNCPFHANPDQAENLSEAPMRDEVGDACDTEPLAFNPPACAMGNLNMGQFCLMDSECDLSKAKDGLGDCFLATDTDLDGEVNLTDNCPTIFNPFQEDNDQDLLGDLCDDNDDGDAFLDVNDNCLFKNNASQSDCDGDCPQAPFDPHPAAHPNCGDACDSLFAGPACSDPGNPCSCPNLSCGKPGPECGDFSFQATGGMPSGATVTDDCTAFRVRNNSSYEYLVDNSSSGLSKIIADCTNCANTILFPQCNEEQGCCNGSPNPKENLEETPIPASFLPNGPQVFKFNPFNHCCDYTGSILFCGRISITDYRRSGDLEFNALPAPRTVRGFDFRGAVPENHTCLDFPAGTFDDGIKPPTSGGSDNCAEHYNPRLCAPGNLTGGDLCVQNVDCDLTNPGDGLGNCLPQSAAPCLCDDDGDGCPDKDDGSCGLDNNWIDFRQDDSQCGNCLPDPGPGICITPNSTSSCHQACYLDGLDCTYAPLFC